MDFYEKCILKMVILASWKLGEACFGKSAFETILIREFIAAPEINCAQVSSRILTKKRNKSLTGGDQVCRRKSGQGTDPTRLLIDRVFAVGLVNGEQRLLLQAGPKRNQTKGGKTGNVIKERLTNKTDHSWKKPLHAPIV